MYIFWFVIACVGAFLLGGMAVAEFADRSEHRLRAQHQDYIEELNRYWNSKLGRAWEVYSRVNKADIAELERMLGL